MTNPRPARAVRAVTGAERIATFIAVSGIVLLVGFIFVVRTSGVDLGSGPRSPEDQRALLASGECAVAPNRALVGKVVGPMAQSRSLPHGGYLLQGVDRPRVFQVDGGDVTIVPCKSIHR